jgi:hypothetical protein
LVRYRLNRLHLGCALSIIVANIQYLLTKNVSHAKSNCATFVPRCTVSNIIQSNVHNDEK